MVSHPQITLEAFLRRDYENERECEYVNGSLIERTGGDVPHARMLMETGYALYTHKNEWQIDVLMSYSMWTSPTCIRVPDLVILNDKLWEEIRRTPPLLCVEILAPEDTPGTLLPRLEDIRQMGVPTIWLIDPIAQVGFKYTALGLLAETPRLTLPNSPIYLDLQELFAPRD